MRFSAKLLQQGIESIGGPVEQSTEAVNIDPVLSTSQTGISGVEALPEHVRMGHCPLRFLIVEPLSEGEAHSMVPRYLLMLVDFHPVQIPVETIEEGVGQPQAEDTGTLLFFAWHRVALSLTAFDFRLSPHCNTFYIFL